MTGRPSPSGAATTAPLTRLGLGVDRDSALVAPVSDERNPAVLTMIASVIEAARAAGRKIGICGQAPSDYPELTRYLGERGIANLSLNPDALIRGLQAIAAARQAAAQGEHGPGLPWTSQRSATPEESAPDRLACNGVTSAPRMRQRRGVDRRTTVDRRDIGDTSMSHALCTSNTGSLIRLMPTRRNLDGRRHVYQAGDHRLARYHDS
jgi:hypothetical protein